MTLIVVWLLTVPGLRLVGGILLIWIAYKLLAADDHDESHEVSPRRQAPGRARRSGVPCAPSSWPTR